MTTTAATNTPTPQQQMQTVLNTFLATLETDADNSANGLLEPAVDKIIAANGDPAVAGQALAGVAVMAPMALPTLIPETILAGAIAAKSILGIANTWIAAQIAKTG